MKNSGNKKILILKTDKMKTIIIACFSLFIGMTSHAQSETRNVEAEQNLKYDGDTLSLELTKDLQTLKQTVSSLKMKEEETQKGKYLKSYQLVLRGIDIVQELYSGTLQIQSARSQNIFYKKVIDMNNPSSDALGFQLLDVIIKSIEDNIATLPIPQPDKARLTGSISNLVDNVKAIFPPLNILSNVLSMASSFSFFRTREEKKKEVSVETVNPIGKDILAKIRNQLVPYIEFYSELDKINSKFQNALYAHVVQYKDYIENLYAVKQDIESAGIDFKVVLADQLNTIFEYNKMGAADFDFITKNKDEKIKKLKINAYSVFDLVDQYKKFTNDFVSIQNDFYQSYIQVLSGKVLFLPIKDDSKVSQLVADLNNTKNGNESEGIIGFDVTYKTRLVSVIAKLAKMNEIRY